MENVTEAFKCERTTWAGWIICAAALAIAAQPGAQPADPVRDPVGHRFRNAPMAEASRSIVIPISTNLHVAFDTELARTHTVWQGPGLNLYGPPYHGGKSPFLCTPEGERLWQMPPQSPWQLHESRAQSPARMAADFESISTEGGVVTLAYRLQVSAGRTVHVRETPLHVGVGKTPVVRRRIEVGPCDLDLVFMAHAEMGELVQVSEDGRAVSVRRTNDVLLAVLDGTLHWEPTASFVLYEEKFNRERNGDSYIETVAVSGRQAQLKVRVPARSETLQFTVDTMVCGDEDEAKRTVEAILAGRRDLAMSAVPRRGTPEQPEIFPSGRPIRPGGDEYVLIEHFSIPADVRLMVTGMDWLPNGNLAICTWPGEIYIVEGAQGAAESARYRRFASGLNEPLGVCVVDDGMYVVQKSELTRIRDTDGDGEADLFESICNDWGYSGNYHAFAFGPVRKSADEWFVFLCGQRGRWEIPYVGWAIHVDANGNIEPFCHGLRAPNGVGTYRGDLFMTENQGNWIGACKLNHLQRKRFYGFPSGTPAPKSEYANPPQFEPPAVWFPRKLSPSTSGFDTIPAGFGPFEGQMLVGDFQNAVVLRVALEKVNGSWQGAVWPFARGFYSGVNRLTFGSDGRAYVGGLKNRAWAATAPKEFSLDRVSFRGKMPFEVLQVRATTKGFQLQFTERVDAAGASAPDNYFVAQFGYRYHSAYGSPEFDHDGNENSMTEIEVSSATVGEDGRTVDLVLEGLRPGYVTMFRLGDIVSGADSGETPLWHDTFYYTLNQVPGANEKNALSR